MTEGETACIYANMQYANKWRIAIALLTTQPTLVACHPRCNPFLHCTLNMRPVLHANWIHAAEEADLNDADSDLLLFLSGHMRAPGMKQSLHG
jgi:hypothetical protein